MDTTNTLQVSTIIIGLLGGLALFLFGMEQITDALKIITGQKVRNLLASMTTTPFKAVLAGTAVTAIIQSSSVTTVLIVGFISAGLITLPQSMGVILGASIGATVTAQIIAFKITHYGLIMIFIGFIAPFIIKQEKIRRYGLMLMGLGLIFFGMELMGDATRPLRAYQPFIALMQRMETSFMGILIGALFTAIIQSSAATIGIVIILASQGLIPLETGIAITLGANIGTCTTALMASIGKPREAVQSAMAHMIFKVVGVSIWYPFIDQLAAIVQFISPTYPALSGEAQLAAAIPRQIANTHTLFNVTNALLLIWFAGPLARLMQYLMPEEETTFSSEITGPIYLEKILLETPDLALDRVKLEIGWLGAYALRMMRVALPTVFNGTQEDLNALEKMDDEVDALHGGIVTYLSELSQENLLRQQSKQLYDYMAVANYLENIGDMIEVNLTAAGIERLKQHLEIGDTTQDLLTALHEKICWTVERAMEAIATDNKDVAEEVMAAKAEINQLANAVDNHLLYRLTVDEPDRLALFRIESELIEYLKRMYYFAKRIAKIIAEADEGHLPREIRRRPRK